MSEAKRLALRSFAHQQQRERETRRTPRAAKRVKTAAALRRRSDKNIKDAKVKLALHRQRARAHEFRRDRTQAEVDRLGEQGLAHKALDGSGYHFPVENEGDLRNAIEAVNRARAGERWSIRKFLIRRAKELGLMALIPRHWEAAGHLEGTEHPVKGRYPSSGPPRD